MTTEDRSGHDPEGSTEEHSSDELAKGLASSGAAWVRTTLPDE